MNSPTKPRGRSWIITTCRGRLEHLRVSLPSWLEHLPDWDPVVVCCDDREAADYAKGELLLAGRGICVEVRQGEYFNKIEALRIGIGVAASGLGTEGKTVTFEEMAKSPGWRNVGERDMVALLDADTVAIDRTWKVLASVDPSNAGIAGWGTRDDLGFLVCSLRALWAGIEQIPAGMFNGYGPEDASLRVAVWTQLKRPFLLLRPEWARRQHNDRLRTRFYERPCKVAVPANKAAQGQLMAALLHPDDVAQCKADCLVWPKLGR